MSLESVLKSLVQRFKKKKQKLASNGNTGTSVVVQWLKLCTPNAGGLGSIPGQGTISHILHKRSMIPYAITKIQHNQNLKNNNNEHVP